MIFYLVYIFIGVFAGTLSGLLGLGGGLVVVPCLAAVFKAQNIFPQDMLMHVAIGTSLAVMICTTFSAALAQAKRNAIRFDIVKTLIPGFSIGIITGYFIQNSLSSYYLKIFFGVFLLFVCYKLLFKRLPEVEQNYKKLRYPVIATFFMGILGCLLGVGGGIIMLPYLINHGVGIRQAMGTTTACGLWISILATSLYILLSTSKVAAPLSLGYIYIPAFLGIAASSVFFAPIGASFAHRLSTEKLNKILAFFLFIVSMDMLFY